VKPKRIGILLTLLALAPTGTFAGPLTDGTFLTSEIWNDGQAEIAFYQVERELDQYGRAHPQSFLMGTYLVKHDFDRARQSKARRDAGDGVPAFKWAAFYEFESDNSYQYKHNYVVNAAQKDLAPLKASYTSFDWCSNQYRELAFLPGGEAELWMRSDDYGNDHKTFEAPANAYPVTLIPLLVRALDFSDSPEQTFSLLLEDGATVPVTAKLIGRESVELAAGEVQDAERIDLTYAGEFRSFVSRRGARNETYWRAPDGDRRLLEWESATYRVELVELVRSPYWKENVYERLVRVKSRP